MSTSTPNEPQGEGAEFEAMPVEAPRRAASLTIRDASARESHAASMDAANKSLGDALKITYVLIQIVMVALVALFAFSGFKQLDQSERGIEVRLGELARSELEPGFHLSLPYPLGEIRKVSTAQISMDLEESFWPYLNKDQKNLPLDSYPRGGLKPGYDGSLLTGDGNLMHVRLGITYHRSDPAEFVKDLADGEESDMVQALVERATIRAVAQLRLDDILKRGLVRSQQQAADAKSPGTAGAAPAADKAPGAAATAAVPAGTPATGRGASRLEEDIRTIAQRSIDELKLGIHLDVVTMRELTAPIAVRESYQGVQSAESDAGKARDAAEETRQKTLNKAAGTAYPVLLALIDDYTRKLDAKDDAGSEAVLQTMFDVLDGKYNTNDEDRVAGRVKSLAVGGKTFSDFQVSGEASSEIAGASQYRSSVVQKAKSDTQTFEAKLSQYRANPGVFLTREWVDAMLSFLGQDQVEGLMVPRGTSDLQLAVSRDPDVARIMKARLQKKELEENPAYASALNAGRPNTTQVAPPK